MKKMRWMVMALAKTVKNQDAVKVDRMADSAREASDFLKALAHESRLMILCNLLDGEKSVGELEAFLSLRQSTVSQQLARLRLEGLVSARRDGKTIHYSIADGKVRAIISVLYNAFCGRQPRRASSGLQYSSGRASRVD
jgi:ArsR family transcriptional regulator, virulence genes transcriptional regulator